MSSSAAASPSREWFDRRPQPLFVGLVVLGRFGVVHEERSMSDTCGTSKSRGFAREQPSRGVILSCGRRAPPVNGEKCAR